MAQPGLGSRLDGGRDESTIPTSIAAPDGGFVARLTTMTTTTLTTSAGRPTTVPAGTAFNAMEPRAGTATIRPSQIAPAASPAAVTRRHSIDKNKAGVSSPTMLYRFVIRLSSLALLCATSTTAAVVKTITPMRVRASDDDQRLDSGPTTLRGVLSMSSGATKQSKTTTSFALGIPVPLTGGYDDHAAGLDGVIAVGRDMEPRPRATSAISKKSWSCAATSAGIRWRSAQTGRPSGLNTAVRS
ncbi:hypothetical protein ACIBL3_37830 [Kribbella sp. NPDC050124]|uniref:hypothetical protein n=1 Tax=Kribbella sp. NPDC050124 TaxID=3364114 RepID=UPI0037A78402